MGVSCIGANGADFSNNWWYWRPLAEYCFSVHPALEATEHYQRWSTNDGKMTAAEAKLLGDKLRAEVTSGRTLLYLQQRRREIEGLPDEKCEHCNGTGIRHHTPLTVSTYATFGNKSPMVGDSFECNGCGGLGTRRPWAASYPFTVENVLAFSDFCRTCGGFEVH